MIKKLKITLKNIVYFIKENFWIPWVFIIWIIFLLPWVAKYLNYYPPFNTINLTYTLSFSWAILAFWYWYKRYERDKEQHYISEWLFKIEDDAIKIFEKFYESIYLMEKGYISENTFIFMTSKFWIFFSKNILELQAKNDTEKLKEIEYKIHLLKKTKWDLNSSGWEDHTNMIFWVIEKILQGIKDKDIESTKVVNKVLSFISKLKT